MARLSASEHSAPALTRETEHVTGGSRQLAAVRRARHNRAGGGGFELANRKPSVAIAWILAIFFIPVLGIAFFLLTGFGKLPRKRRERQREVCEATLARTDGLDQVSHREEWPSWLASMVT